MLFELFKNTYIIIGALIQIYRLLPNAWLVPIKAKFPKIEIFAFLISAILISYRTFSVIFSKSISVSPESLTFRKSDWTATKFITIQNHTKEPLYLVCLKIWAIDHDIVLDHFKFDYHSDETIYDQKTGDLSIKRNLIVIYGTEISRNRDNLYFQFTRIDPQEPIQLKISYKVNQTVQLKTKILFHSEKAPSQHSRGTQQSFPLISPESIKVKSIFHQLRKDI